MIWRHSLDAVVIEEPIGFDAIVFNVMRDEKWHGVFFEASNSTLGFYGAAYTILKTAKESYGVDAVVIFKAEVKCGDEDFETAIEGKLNFSRYQETCGNECIVRMSVEQNNCAMVFKNRFDQKVDIDTPIAFDKSTNLVQYPGLGFTMELATQVIPISADASVSADTGVIPSGPNLSCNLLIRPIYGTVRDNSIITGQLNDPTNFWQDCDQFFNLSPQVLIEENASCVPNNYDYNVRLKGSASIEILVGTGYNLQSVLAYWDGNGDLATDGVVIASTSLQIGMADGVVYNFDETYSGNITLPAGVGVYAYIGIIWISGVNHNINATYTFDEETLFYLYTIKACPPTDAEVYLVNETLARITESITDRCLTIESDYYGRTDSEPYDHDQDGCGSLRVLTPGLRIRQATDKNFFASMKEVMEGLRAIDNIGMGMESDRVRIEPAQYFYQDTKILDLDLVPQSRTDVDDSKVYSNLKTGYAKWEIKSIKGIDEFNSAKEYRTSLKSISNELDIRSNLIASGYIIETLRTSTLVNTGNTDNTYDNDVFIICVDREAYGYQVEQGIAENAANFFSPSTAYNWRIRPIYNLMRWFKSIAQSYVNLSNTASKLFFTSGTGNYLAEGEISVYDICRLESGVIPENEDVDITDFQNLSDALPIYKPETVTFNYPLSVRDYKLIKASPYGYFNVQCGGGDFIKAYIKNIEYKPAAGTAQFTLTKKWL